MLLPEENRRAVQTNDCRRVNNLLERLGVFPFEQQALTHVAV